MDITVNRVDCSPFLQQGQQPTLILKDGLPEGRSADFSQSKALRPGQWEVANSVHHPDQPMQTSLAERGSGNIRVPLFSYTTNGRSFETLIGTAMHLAFSVAKSLQLDNVDQIHIAVGSVYAVRNPPEGYQIWIGLAFHHKE